MTLGAALQDILAFGFPVLIYALVARLRYGFGAQEIAQRLGLTLGAGRVYAYALAIALPFSLLTISISSWTSGFKGSMIAPTLWPLAILLPLALGLANGWLREKSGSIGPGVLLHAIPNIAGALAVLNLR